MSSETERLPYGEGREALMMAVVRLVARKGLRGATYRAVAAEAGVNHNLIAHHFGSMDALLSATTEWAVERSIADTQLGLFVELDERFADALIASVSAEPELHLFQFEMILEARRRPELREASARLYENYVASVQQALKNRGMEADEGLCSAVFAALDGLMLQFLTLGKPAQIRSAVIQVGRLLALALDPRNETAQSRTAAGRHQPV